MKNKKNILILLPVVLLIWGGVIYQFSSFLNTENATLYKVKEINIKPFKFKERNKFSININYRDPFLGKMYTNTQQAPKTNSTLKTIKAIKPELIMVWPTILYKGIVSDTKEKNKVFMMVITGHIFLMKKGDIENDIHIEDGDNASVSVKYKGYKNIIMIEK